jgi:hypothetical protein
MSAARGASSANPFHSFADLCQSNGIDGQIFSLPKQDLDDLLKELRLSAEMRLVMHAHIREWKKNPQSAHDIIKAEQERMEAESKAASKTFPAARSKKSALR